MQKEYSIKNIFAISLILEIILFPWINAFEEISVIFYTLFVINIFVSLFKVRKENLFLNKIDHVFLIFVLITLFNPFNLIFEFSVNAPYVRLFAFFVRYLLLDIKLIEKNANLFSAGVLVSSLMVFFLNPIETSSDNFRLFYPYGDPNYVSFIFGSYIFIIYIFLHSGLKNNFFSLIKIITILSCTVVVVLTASRGGLLSLLFSIIVVILRKNSIPKLILLGSLVLLIVSNLNLSFINNLNAFNRFFNPRGSDDGAMNSRFQENTAVFNSFTNNPSLYVFGRGLSSSNITSSTYSHIFRIHNTFISVFNDSGLIGLTFFLVYIFRLFYHNYQKASFFLLFFLVFNSQTIYLLTIYQFHICLKFLTIRKEST